MVIHRSVHRFLEFVAPSATPAMSTPVTRSRPLVMQPVCRSPDVSVSGERQDARPRAPLRRLCQRSLQPRQAGVVSDGDCGQSVDCPRVPGGRHIAPGAPFRHARMKQAPLRSDSSAACKCGRTRERRLVTILLAEEEPLATRRRTNGQPFVFWLTCLVKKLWISCEFVKGAVTSRQARCAFIVSQPQGMWPFCHRLGRSAERSKNLIEGDLRARLMLRKGARQLAA
jgi:hypothetical protein